MRVGDSRHDLGKEAKNKKLELNTTTAKIIPDNSQSVKSYIGAGNENQKNVSLLNLNRDQENILNQIFLPK